MTPEEQIDENLLRVLRAGESSVRANTILLNDIDSMRQAMRDIMSESYIAGSNACHKAKKGDES